MVETKVQQNTAADRFTFLHVYVVILYLFSFIGVAYTLYLVSQISSYDGSRGFVLGAKHYSTFFIGIFYCLGIAATAQLIKAFLSAEHNLYLLNKRVNAFIDDLD